MTPDIAKLVTSVTGANAITKSTVIQSLWSGYGQIVRIELIGGTHSSVVIKHIKSPDIGQHPRGWNTDLSHQRKVRSYDVEAKWYQTYSARCDDNCTVPKCLAVSNDERETILVLTDLDAMGFDHRKDRAEIEDIHACLSWLAHFHATFLNTDPHGLWDCGTYWHLATRPDELAALDDVELKRAAPLIDQRLSQSRYQTLVHGDAKLANFCFRGSESLERESNQSLSSQVAAVDFQYVGRGCGMKDVAYFIGSCLYDDECEAMEESLLNVYFDTLRGQLIKRGSSANVSELEQEWRSLYPYAWADFHRFIKGWSPGHWKINSYSERLTAAVIQRLKL